MKKILSKIKGFLPSKRRLIQLYAALLFNANLKGFASGKIYGGGVKNICTPGLNCYSCPGASGACPLGSLQNSLAASGKTAPYYVFGIILLYGIIFGRIICGFLCPFGLIQDLLHKIPTPKLKKNRFTKALSYLKYVILVFFVLIIPLVYMTKDLPLPAFCKYICPAGTLGGAIGLLINPKNNELFGMLGPLFTWKFALLISFIVACIFIYRTFCRFFCPLGALYGLLNRFAILGIKLDKPSCTECGRCIKKCKMDISRVGDAECINCGECISECPTGAIQWRGGKILLPQNDLPQNASVEEKHAYEQKSKKKRLIIRIVAAVLMVSTLVGALVYYNFIDSDTTTQAGPVEGALTVGDPLPSDMPPELGKGGARLDLNTLTTPLALGFINVDNSTASDYIHTLDELARTAPGTVVAILVGCTEQEAVTFLMSELGTINFDIKYAYDEDCSYYSKYSKDTESSKTYIVSGARLIYQIFASDATADTLLVALNLANTNAEFGNKEGKLCVGRDLAFIDGFGDGVFNVTDQKWRGKTVVLNFWYTDCTPCVHELPYFNKAASDYYDRDVVIVTIHNANNWDGTAPQFIESTFPASKMLFVRDVEGDLYYKSDLGFNAAYPATIIVDGRGIISYRKVGALDEDELRREIDKALLTTLSE